MPRTRPKERSARFTEELVPPLEGQYRHLGQRACWDCFCNLETAQATLFGCSPLQEFELVCHHHHHHHHFMMNTITTVFIIVVININ